MMMPPSHSSSELESNVPALARSPSTSAGAESPIAAAAHSAPSRLIHPHHSHGLLPALHSLLSIVVIAVFIITFCAQPFRIPSESMEPTLLVGDFLLVDKQSIGKQGSGLASALLPDAAIHRGDVIVFHFPVDPSMHLVKRVVGLPGDHLKLREGHVLLSGVALPEPYAVYRPSGPDNFRDNFPRLQSADPEVDSHWWIQMHTLVDHGELIVPQDSYFVLGDNRNDSEDSRYWGLVPRVNVVGKPLLIYFSLRNSGHESASLLALPRSAQSDPPDAARPSSALLDFARWDRTLRVVR